MSTKEHSHTQTQNESPRDPLQKVILRPKYRTSREQAQQQKERERQKERVIEIERLKEIEAEKERQHIQDSLNRLKPKVDAVQLQATDSLAKRDSSLAGLKQDSTAKEQLQTVETQLFKITFSNKGGQPKTILLKNFTTFNGSPLVLQDGNFNNISYAINTGNNQTAQTGDLLFTPLPVETAADGSQIVSYRLRTNNGESIEHQYIIKADDYMIAFNIKLNGAQKLFTQNTLNLLWQAKAVQKEKDIEWETQQSHVSFVENGDYDFEHIVKGKDDDKKFTEPVDWLALNQQFFCCCHCCQK